MVTWSTLAGDGTKLKQSASTCTSGVEILERYLERHLSYGFLDGKEEMEENLVTPRSAAPSTSPALSGSNIFYRSVLLPNSEQCVHRRTFFTAWKLLNKTKSDSFLSSAFYKYLSRRTYQAKTPLPELMLALRTQIWALTAHFRSCHVMFIVVHRRWNQIRFPSPSSRHGSLASSSR